MVWCWDITGSEFHVTTYHCMPFEYSRSFDLALFHFWATFLFRIILPTLYHTCPAIVAKEPFTGAHCIWAFFLIIFASITGQESRQAGCRFMHLLPERQL